MRQLNPENKADGGRFDMLGHRRTSVKTPQQRFDRIRRRVSSRRGRRHDPMLVLNMSIFNFGDGWNRTFNPLKVHENGTS
jgi:hypothetical protein